LDFFRGIALMIIFINHMPLNEWFFYFGHFFDQTQEALFGLITLHYVPMYLDILPMYLLVMLWIPVVWLLSRIHRALALGVPLLVYLARVFPTSAERCSIGPAGTPLPRPESIWRASACCCWFRRVGSGWTPSRGGRPAGRTGFG
jgi:hypothetical protein